jgi:hypothetical protein
MTVPKTVATVARTTALAAITARPAAFRSVQCWYMS